MVLDVLVIGTNICEQFIIIKGWKHLDRIDHLLLSLSVSDLIFGFAALTMDSWYLARELKQLDNENNNSTKRCFSITIDESKSEFLEKYHPIINCTIEAAFVFTLFVSVLHVMALAIERLFAVRFPQKYHIFNMFKTKFFTISVIWSGGLFLTVIQVGAVGAMERGNSFARTVLLALVTMAVFVLYLCVAFFLFKQHRSMSRDFMSDSFVNLGKLRRLTVICLFIGISYVLCNAPINVQYFNKVYLGGGKWTAKFLPEEFLYVSSFMVTLNSAINPCIYFIKVYYDRDTPARGTLRGSVGAGDGARLMDERRSRGRSHGDTTSTIVEGNGAGKFGSGSLAKSKSNDLLMNLCDSSSPSINAVD